MNQLMEPPNTSFETAEGTTGTTETAGTDLSVDALVARTEEYARHEPMKAVSGAFVAGLIITLLPIGSLIAGVIRLGLGLLRPALLILGAVKLYEEIERRQNG